MIIIEVVTAPNRRLQAISRGNAWAVYDRMLTGCKFYRPPYARVTMLLPEDTPAAIAAATEVSLREQRFGPLSIGLVISAVSVIPMPSFW